MRIPASLALLALIPACRTPTAFTGSPVISGGRAQCAQVCAAWEMELAGMVQMGEYSSGCICQVPGKDPAPQAAAGQAAAGVWTQTLARRAREHQDLHRDPHYGR